MVSTAMSEATVVTATMAGHWVAAPILLPLAAGVVALMVDSRPRAAALVSIVSTIGLGLIAIHLLIAASSGSITVYLLGNWRAPFGIALALDRLSALMVALTAAIGLVSVLYARGGDAQGPHDGRGAHFHALVQFQLAGVCGAFLTADLFNLFVFFELLLIASYGLLLHGGSAPRVRAAIHYVIFNLVGSALFLVAVALLYGVTGTLNMADLAVRIAAVAPQSAPLVHAAILLLLVVFGVKAALFPLYFWLPETYRAAPAPVAALFAIMTKVGVYGVARVSTLMLGADAGSLADVGRDELTWLALATLALATGGALAAPRLRTLAAYLAIASTGTLLLALGLGSPNSVAAAVFYLVPSTLVGAALFLLIDTITAGRGEAADRLVAAPLATRAALGALFFLFALEAAGLPPFGGFVGKLMLLQASVEATGVAVVWGALLLSSLGMIIALARAGSTVFWCALEPNRVQAQAVVATAPERAALALLVVASLLIGLNAGAIAEYAQATAAQLIHPDAYVGAVLGAAPR